MCNPPCFNRGERTSKILSLYTTQPGHTWNWSIPRETIRTWARPVVIWGMGERGWFWIHEMCHCLQSYDSVRVWCICVDVSSCYLGPSCAGWLWVMIVRIAHPMSSRLCGLCCSCVYSLHIISFRRLLQRILFSLLHFLTLLLLLPFCFVSACLSVCLPAWSSFFLSCSFSPAPLSPPLVSFLLLLRFHIILAITIIFIMSGHLTSLYTADYIIHRFNSPPPPPPPKKEINIWKTQSWI